MLEVVRALPWWSDAYPLIVLIIVGLLLADWLNRFTLKKPTIGGNRDRQTVK